MEMLRQRFSEQDLTVDFIRAERPGIEDVFVHLVGEWRNRS
jgi:hypothetical protein